MTEPIDTARELSPARDPVIQAAAVFLGQVLGIADSPDYLAADLSPIKRDANASIFTIQLDSSVGPAAFLVYAYALRQRGGDGRTGKDLFDAGLATLRQAAQRSAPGPRAVAHTETDDLGFILATTPGTYRALTGDPEIEDAEPVPPANAVDRGAMEDAAQIRSDIALDLLDSLRNANRYATEWLAAIEVSGPINGDEAEHDPRTFTAEETELALYLLDDDSIGNLLRALNILVASAQHQAAQGLDQR